MEANETQLKDVTGTGETQAKANVGAKKSAAQQFEGPGGSKANGYLGEFSNFADDGLNLTITYYTGPKPNLVWYFTAVIYKNSLISVDLWNFAGHMNVSEPISDTNSTLQALETVYPN